MLIINEIISKINRKQTIHTLSSNIRTSVTDPSVNEERIAPCREKVSRLIRIKFLNARLLLLRSI